MRNLGQLFSLLVLLALIGSAALLWVRPAPNPQPEPQLALSGPLDRIVIEKSARRMTLIQNGAPVRVWPIALGFSPTGDKEREGDGRTPEGSFVIDRRNNSSSYHLSLGLSYPQPDDIARAKAAGYSPGGDIMIHGQPNSLPEAMIVKGDWTAGCIALTNAQMREIWDHTPTGTVIEIKP